MTARDWKVAALGAAAGALIMGAVWACWPKREIIVRFGLPQISEKQREKQAEWLRDLREQIERDKLEAARIERDAEKEWQEVLDRVKR